MCLLVLMNVSSGDIRPQVWVWTLPPISFMAIGWYWHLHTGAFTWSLVSMLTCESSDQIIPSKISDILSTSRQDNWNINRNMNMNSNWVCLLANWCYSRNHSWLIANVLVELMRLFGNDGKGNRTLSSLKMCLSFWPYHCSQILVMLGSTGKNVALLCLAANRSLWSGKRTTCALSFIIFCLLWNKATVPLPFHVVACARHDSNTRAD